MALEIEITSQKPDGRRLALRGRLDTTTAPQLEAQLAPLLDSPEVRVKRVFEIVKALPPEQVFASEAEFDAYLDVMQRKARE